jgi:predicted transcriptional regulator
VRAMQLEIELDNDSVEKLAYIQKQTNQDVNDVIKQAIGQYYNQIQTTQVATVQNQKSPLTIFLRSLV